MGRAVGAVALAALVACRDDDFRLSAHLRGTADVSAAQELTVDGAVPSRLTLTLDDGEDVRVATFDALRRTRDLPLVGLRPGVRTEVTLLAEAEDGGTATRQWHVRTPSLPRGFPAVEVLALDPDRAWPGWTLLDLEVGDASWLAVLDPSAEVVWWMALDAPPSDARLRDDGALQLLLDGGVVRMDWLGRQLQRTGAAPDPAAEAWVPAPLVEVHHEASPLPDGLVVLDRAERDVDAYPQSYGRRRLGPAHIAESAVVRLDDDGRVLLRVPLADVLDPERIGFDSLSETATGAEDWAHANGVIPHESDGGWVVSARHQDCVFELGPDGALRWILGTPAGWGPPWSGLRLRPVGEVTWPYHQHAPAFAPDGTLLLFDNHNDGRTPYDEPVAGDVHSRVVRYRIDEEARTVEQVAVYEDTATGPLWSMALGSAHELPNGDVVGLFGLLEQEGGVDDEARGWGRHSARLVEWSPEGDVVRDVRLRTDAADPGGVRSYRAWPLETPWTGPPGQRGAWSVP
ncbi:MAG: aryl-sulfate sulfotransferase [Myxococcota bacterium]